MGSRSEEREVPKGVLKDGDRYKNKLSGAIVILEHNVIWPDSWRLTYENEDRGLLETESADSEHMYYRLTEYYEKVSPGEKEELEKIEINQVYKDYKGEDYVVIALAKEPTDRRQGVFVVYQTRDKTETFIKPYFEFISNKYNEKGEIVKQFQLKG